jgi:hypothetical protein
MEAPAVVRRGLDYKVSSLANFDLDMPTEASETIGGIPRSVVLGARVQDAACRQGLKAAEKLAEQLAEGDLHLLALLRATAAQATHCQIEGVSSKDNGRMGRKLMERLDGIAHPSWMAPPPSSNFRQRQLDEQRAAADAYAGLRGQLNVRSAAQAGMVPNKIESCNGLKPAPKDSFLVAIVPVRMSNPALSMNTKDRNVYW